MEESTNYQEEKQPSGSQAVRQLRQRARDGSLKEVWQEWKWIWSFCRGHWGGVILYTLCGIASSGVALAASVASKYLIDCIVSLDRQRLLPLALGMMALTGLSLLFRSATSRYAARLNVRMHNDIQERVFSSLMASKWPQIRQFSTGDLMSRFSGDLNTVSGCAVSWLPGVVIQSFTMLATLAVVLYYDPMMALIAFASTPVLLFASRRLLRRQRGYNQRLRQTSAGMSAFQAETFRNVDTLKSFGVESDVLEKLRHWQKTQADVTLEYNDFSIRTNLWLTLMGTAVQYLAMAYCLWRLWKGEILFGTMVLFLQQRSQLSSAFSSLIGQIPTILSGSVAAQRLRELTQLEKEPRSRDGRSPRGRCCVSLENVRAVYSDDRRAVLTDVSLTAPAGSIVALIGPSGEGKSTLMRLMLGLMPPDQGRVILTDEDGNVFPMGADTRGAIAYVPQGNTVLSGTIGENLRLVRRDATDGELIQALEDACAWEFVSQMPRGLESVLGEGGKGLSEGQAQRIAIARALVRRAPVLLLDEVTSALDQETEARVLANLSRRGVTCITATHRPGVLGMCSRVYRVQNGRVELLSGDAVARMLPQEN